MELRKRRHFVTLRKKNRWKSRGFLIRHSGLSIVAPCLFRVPNKFPSASSDFSVTAFPHSASSRHPPYFSFLRLPPLFALPVLHLLPLLPLPLHSPSSNTTSYLPRRRSNQPSSHASPGPSLPAQIQVHNGLARRTPRPGLTHRLPPSRPRRRLPHPIRRPRRRSRALPLTAGTSLWPSSFLSLAMSSPSGLSSIPYH